MTLSSSRKRRIKDAAKVAVEMFWSAGASIAGRLWRPEVAGWASPGRQRVLVVAPHPDDEAVGCAGTIARHKQRGDTVWVCCVTDGRRSRALGLGPEEMARRRAREAEACAAALRIDRLAWLGLPEGAWAAEQLGPMLGALLDQFAPDLVYAPSRVDFHPEHHAVAAALAALLCAPMQRDDQRRPLVRIYQVQVPLTPTLTNLIVDTSGVTDASDAALRAYVTQWGSIARALRSRRYAARFYGAAHSAEEFWELNLAQYHLLHAEPPEQWSRQVFRSLRPRAPSDPLAYLLGQAERRRLAALISGAPGEERQTYGRSRSFLIAKRARSAKGRKG